MVSANASRSTLNTPMLITRHLPYIDILWGSTFGTYHISVVATYDDASGTSMRCTMVYKISR
jgi:hypothetical protein